MNVQSDRKVCTFRIFILFERTLKFRQEIPSSIFLFAFPCITKRSLDCENDVPLATPPPSSRVAGLVDSNQPTWQDFRPKKLVDVWLESNEIPKTSETFGDLKIKLFFETIKIPRRPSVEIPLSRLWEKKRISSVRILDCSNWSERGFIPWYSNALKHDFALNERKKDRGPVSGSS